MVKSFGTAGKVGKIRIHRVEIGVTGDAVPVFEVTPIWSNVDRIEGCKVKADSYKVAAALAQAITDGVWFIDAKRLTDSKGSTFVAEKAFAYGSDVKVALSALSYL